MRFPLPAAFRFNSRALPLALAGSVAIGAWAAMPRDVLAYDRPEPALTVLSVTASAAPQSLRITNTERFGAGATVIIRNAAGQTLGTWQSPVIAPQAAPAFAITQILTEAGVTDSSGNYTFIVSTTFEGFAQTLAMDTATGMMTNTSTCSRQYFDREDEFAAGAVISTASGGGSELQLYNEKKKARTARLTVYNAASGAMLGDVTTPSLDARNTTTVNVGTLLANASFARTLTPSTVVNLKVVTDDVEAVHILRSGTLTTDLSAGCEFDDDVTLAQLDQR